MIVRLSKSDSHAATMLAQDTVRLLEMMGVSPRLENSKQSRLEANILGFKAEYAVARVMGCEMPTLNIATDGGVDLWIDDLSIDVKFTNRMDGDLIFDNLDKFKADIAILVCHVEDDKFKIIGWCSRTMFEMIATAKNYGYGDRAVVEGDNLNPLGKLWEKIMERKYS